MMSGTWPPGWRGAVNPLRPELADQLLSTGLPVVSIETLQSRAKAAAERRPRQSADGRIVAVSEYRDGTATDVVRQATEG